MDYLRVYLLYGSAHGDPDVWNGLDHPRFGMDRGYGSACGFRVWIGALCFDSHSHMGLSENRVQYIPNYSHLIGIMIINH